MQTLDWILLGVLLVSLLLGLWRGLVYEVLSLLNWVVAFVLAQWLAPDLGARLPMGNSSDAVRYVAAFVLLLVAALFTLGLVAVLVKKLIAAVGLRPVDRMLGGLFGLLRGVVLLLAVTAVVGMLPLKSWPVWQQSTGAQWLMQSLRAITPLLPDEFGRYIALKDD